MTETEKTIRSRASFFESARDERQFVAELDTLRLQVKHQAERNAALEARTVAVEELFTTWSAEAHRNGWMAALNRLGPLVTNRSIAGMSAKDALEWVHAELREMQENPPW